MLTAKIMALAAASLVEMQHGMPDAHFVAEYTSAERAAAAQIVLNLAAAPALGEPVSLTPNAPYARGGAHLSFWKPSFVIGTANGGEAGINYWGLHRDGHVNVAISGTRTLLDCRVLSAHAIAYKIYRGTSGTPDQQGAAPIHDGHLLLEVAAGEPASVELWPAPRTQPVAIFGCDISKVLP